MNSSILVLLSLGLVAAAEYDYPGTACYNAGKRYCYFSGDDGGTEQCFEQDQECDREEQCDNGADEMRCKQGPAFDCGYGMMWTCVDMSYCISYKFLCDGIEDCDDGSDEDGDYCEEAFY